MLYESLVEWCIYANGALMTLLSQYFDHHGFSALQIGMLMAVGPIVSLVANPFWLQVKQRLGSKRTIGILTLTSGLLVWTIFAVTSFRLTLMSLLLVIFFMASVVPIAEAHVMASLMKKGQSFDYPRMWGTIGYTCTAFIAGFLFRISFVALFMGVSLALLLAFAFSLKLNPAAPNTGVARKTSGTGQWGIFLGMLGIASTVTALTSFGPAFVPRLISQRGYDVATAGTCFAVMAFAEVPFLSFAGKILKKIGNFPLLVSGVFMTGLRTFLTPESTSPTTLALVHLLSGWNYIVIYYALWNYIHYHLPESQSVKAQTLMWMALGIGGLAGTFGGGYLVESFGLVKTFHLLGLGLMLFAIPLFMGSAVFKAKPKLLNA